VTFTKYFQDLSFGELADRIAETGVAGIEAPVRPGGHIEPERVEDELPRLVEALRGRGLALEILTSGITGVSDAQRTEAVLRTAAGLGIPRYRMGYYKYDLSRPIQPQLDEIRPRLADLAALNRELGIQAVYQNHSGRDYVGGPVWDIVDLVRPHDPGQIALAFDIGHATVEGSVTWELDFARARPHLGAVFVKDYRLEGRSRRGVPLGEGSVNPKFFPLLASLEPRVPVSLHVEHLPDEPPGPERTRRHLEAIRKDVALLREWLEG
jgi:sugar phosphate isomerase/epimerase